MDAKKARNANTPLVPQNPHPRKKQASLHIPSTPILLSPPQPLNTPRNPASAAEKGRFMTNTVEPSTPPAPPPAAAAACLPGEPFPSSAAAGVAKSPPAAVAAAASFEGEVRARLLFLLSLSSPWLSPTAAGEAEAAESLLRLLLRLAPRSSCLCCCCFLLFCCCWRCVGCIVRRQEGAFHERGEGGTWTSMVG